MCRTWPIQGCLRVQPLAADWAPSIISLLVDGLDLVLDRPIERLDSGIDIAEVLVIKLDNVVCTVHALPPFRIFAYYFLG
jgi:hypothetical protein